MASSPRKLHTLGREDRRIPPASSTSLTCVKMGRVRQLGARDKEQRDGEWVKVTQEHGHHTSQPM